MQALHDRSHYSPAVQVGNILYIAGQVGRDDDLNVILDPRLQYERAFENLRTVLNAAGATPDDVFELMSFHTSLDDYAMFRDMKNGFFVNEPYPTHTVIGVTTLAAEGLRVEIKCTAVLG
jgi:enamine deaminase RidA (YjgF/YER057c/UK114 family)